jgi:hypothetical protein
LPSTKLLANCSYLPFAITFQQTITCFKSNTKKSNKIIQELQYSTSNYNKLLSLENESKAKENKNKNTTYPIIFRCSSTLVFHSSYNISLSSIPSITLYTRMMGIHLLIPFFHKPHSVHIPPTKVGPLS